MKPSKPPASTPDSAPATAAESQSAAELEAMLAQALGKLPKAAAAPDPAAALANQPLVPGGVAAEGVAGAAAEGSADAAADAIAPGASAGVEAPRRCGLVAIVGRPNVGKSTLLNALVGQKVSITSAKAQTTRHRITGVLTQGASQFVFVDTPGFQTRHSNALNRSLNKTVLGTVADVDLIVFVLEAGRFGPADAQVLALLPPQVPTLLLANKLDAVANRADLAPWLLQMQQRHPFAEYVPMSAKSTRDVQRLLAIVEKYLPQQDWLHEADALTDRSERFMAAEMVREKLFRLTGDELPYTSTVLIDQFEQEGTLRRIAATIVVEREGHKGMVIGEGGEKLKRIGSEARQELEKLWDCKVFLQLWVKVRSGWADNEARVRSFGYE